MTQEPAYLALVDKIINSGERREGRNGVTYSLFGERLEFDLKQGFPLLTTKRVFWRGVVEELLWFLRGSTDARELQERGVHIWDGNSSREFLDSVGLTELPEGSIGAGYGFQWRCFGGDYPSKRNGMDQLAYVIDELRNNPQGRRAVLSAWNPQQLGQMALPPCHMVYDFYRGNDGLSCQMLMRSCDVAAGLPFNIASTALLTTLLATALGDVAHRIIIVTGDTHLYDQHVSNAAVQVQRSPLAFPEVSIATKPDSSSTPDIIRWIESLTSSEIVLHNYCHHPPLKYAMAA